MNIPELMDAAKTNSNIPSDRALAQKMGVSHALPCHWRHGTHIPSPENAYILAELAGVDELIVIADVLIEGEKRPEVRTAMQRIKSAIVAAATVIPALLLFVTSNIHYTQSRLLDRLSPIRPG